MAFEQLRRGEATLDELLEFEDLKFEFNKNLVSLAKLKAGGKKDENLEKKISEQKILLGEAGELRKKAGVPDHTPREDELRAITKEFKETRDEKLLEKISAILEENHSRKKLISEKALSLAGKKAFEPLPLPTLPPVPGLAVRIIHGRRVDYIREEDAPSFDANEPKIHAANDELQKERLRGNIAHCHELEQTLSVLINNREEFISCAVKLHASAELLKKEEKQAALGLEKKTARA